MARMGTMTPATTPPSTRCGLTTLDHRYHP